MNDIDGLAIQSSLQDPPNSGLASSDLEQILFYIFFYLTNQNFGDGVKLGLYRILIWPDIRQIILPDTGYPAK